MTSGLLGGDQVARIDSVPLCGDFGVQSGDGQQIGADPVHPVQMCQQGVAQGGDGRLIGVEHGGDRVAQVVGGVGGEAALLLGRVLQPARVWLMLSATSWISS
ncbi:hypothetical protein [Nonomuraea sp. KM90]|uniref:hypothetical protein n=1 Tax=Nonomuraea sp. KM90 TaxID=3457428 RepID=UPI003FCD9997